MCDKSCGKIRDSVTLASELLKELKETSRRWFIAFVVMVVLEIATICGFLWYISLPIEETTIEQEAEDDSYNQVIGGDYSGSKTESSIQEKSSTK